MSLARAIPRSRPAPAGRKPPRADIVGAVREALRAPSVRGAMARALFAQGAALALVAAMMVHAALHAGR